MQNSCTHLFLIIIIFTTTIIIPKNIYSQKLNTDTIKTNTSDSIKKPTHSPGKATIMSAIIPGLGQAYNKKYWKIPVLYTGFAILGYYVVNNHKKYTKYHDQYYNKMDSLNHKLGNISSDEITNLIAIKNYYRRNFELSAIFTGVLYILNILDASVDANLYDFDVSDNLALHISPLNYNNGINTYYGLTLTMKFK